jgi:NADH:ubiquinone oxidoreductase subunit 5 (subunit L)/multisubunit Na+/H+ antiporter MnhA subunit/multisubunit Na+/H+ antiporter MnhB subunit
MEFILFLAVPFLLALFTPLLYDAVGRRGLIAIVPGSLLALFVVTLLQLPRVTDGEILQRSIEWVPDLGLMLSFYMDGLALLFMALVTGVGTAIFFYAGHYFDEDADMIRFYRWLLTFTGAMLWLVMAGNLLALFIAWELTSITSFMLIGFKGAKYEDARSGALQALMITGAGGLALVVGLLLIGTAAGSMEYTEILNTSLADHPYYNGIVGLIALAAFTKSAQFPFHFWLPGAMSAPSPASAFLHSATMVKAGIYLLARFYPTLGDTALWENLLVGVGLFTLLMGSVLALRHVDLKGILAYTTIAKLGALVALIGLPEAAGFKALMVGILAHALYKAPLFLSAGIVDHATGTRLIDKLGGLWEKMRGLGIVVGLACISMAGVIPFLGFVGKETLIEAFIDDPLALTVVVVSAVLTVAVAIVIWWQVFMGPLPKKLHFHAPVPAMLYGPAALAGIGAVTGVLLPLTIIPLITPAVPKDFSLYLFPGFNTAFILSTLAIIGGVLLYVVRSLWLRPVSDVPLPTGVTIYGQIVGAVEWSADQLLRTQNGKLRYYLIVILGSVAALMVFSGILVDIARGQSIKVEFDGASDILEVVLVVLALGATLGSIVYRNHLTAALSLGVMGYSVGAIFLLEPAPDVALVQFLVETLGTVLVIIMIGRISRRHRAEAMDRLWESSQEGRWRDIAISVAVGLMVGLFALTAITNRPERVSISEWHIENAYPLTGVVDVVAAIITDFRATDTLIEIMVFGMAALGVLTLFSLTRNQDEELDLEVLERLEAPSPLNRPLPRLVALVMLPFALLISVSHILYAGENPGDGFTAGVISGLAVGLWYIVFGYTEAKQRLIWLKPWWMISGGMAVALVNAVLPLIFGREFFAITKITGVEAPAGLHLASTMIFEIGVFLTVFGGASLIMEALAHPEGLEKIEEIGTTEEVSTNGRGTGDSDGRDVRDGGVSDPTPRSNQGGDGVLHPVHGD